MVLLGTLYPKFRVNVCFEGLKGPVQVRQCDEMWDVPY